MRQRTRSTEALPHYGVKNGLIRHGKCVYRNDKTSQNLIKEFTSVRHAKFAMRTGQGL